ncbi:hypothetical protein [Pseudobutyrivibrio sp. YE44]|uniref:hypothetical protein n=1 Tax=Pseudobutyrivibrio sp. YE44 TaxID=1520802 RepID=UPI000B813371|nr:hypothetical protein [Pseudobutyrivibrio sp. YE44]
MITDVAWFIPLTMISIIVISILNIIFTDRDKHHRNAWMLILASAVAEVIVTAFHYFLISSDSETPVVGFLFCVLYGGLGLIFLLIGTWTNRYREYRKNLKDEK